ncbi:SNF2 family N-terminal domain-containing protein [Phellopilus nigrolimitatus]|nr:SNF2 family N-terminal domain-containing protein [Phellopilus nigrolimitatus]
MAVEEDESAVPVIRHTFEIDFSVEDSEDAPEIQAYISHDRDFLEVLANKCAEQEEQDMPVIFELGTVYPHAYLSNVLACTANPLASGRKTPLPLTRLLTLPVLPEDVNDTDHDFNSRTLKNIFASAYNLQMNKRAKVSGPLQLIVARSPIDKDARELHVTLRITITVSLLEPGVYEPVTTFGKKGSEQEEAQRRILTYAFSSESILPTGYTGWTDVPFFLSCLHPAPALISTEADETAQPTDLLPKLLPFQRRSVAWLLAREGKQISADGRISDDDTVDAQLPFFWEQRTEFLGGILAEEPGLGKTLESIALVLLNPAVDRNPLVSRWDPVGAIDVKEVKTTLIVTPSSLAQQWVDELTLHAPTLKVLVYEGWTKVPVPITAREAQDTALRKMRANRRPKMEALDEGDIADDDDAGDFPLTEKEKKELAKAGNQMTWCDFVQQYDVCITNLGVARAPLQRPRREVAKYVEIYRDRSPLVMVEWNRVIMDEVQMVGGGKTEEMVSLIPRISSFAVSGTPARSSVDDLIHVLKFLRIDVVTGSSKTWARLQKPAFAVHFKELFERIAVRTIKAKVQDELTIPQQRRYVVPIELGKIERHVYDQNFEQALTDLGLDARGVAASSGWAVDVNVLRTWMRKLRGICTHPQVGQLARQNDRLAKAGAALKSINEVLDNMKDQNWRLLMDDKKSRVQILITRAQLTQRDDSNLQSDRVALEILLSAQSDMDAMCTEINYVITEHDARGEILKQEAIAQRQAERLADDDTGASSSKGKGRQRQRSASVSLSEDSLDDELPKTPAGEEHKHKRRALQARLRECRVVLHQIHFLLGNVYNGLGQTYITQEEDAYGIAEDLRKRLLKSAEHAANQSVAQLKLTASKKLVTEESMKIEYCGKGGKKSEELLVEANEIIDILNDQSELLLQWRAGIVKLLTESLSASEGESDGQEYARTLETQGEAETFLQAYAALLADRREVLLAERSALAVHDVRERKTRHTVAAQKAQRAAAGAEAGSTLNRDELQPEHEVLEAELATKRTDLWKGFSGRAIKSIYVDLQGVVGSIQSDKDPEKIIAKEWNTKLKTVNKEQCKFSLALHDKLEADMMQFRKAFNNRIQYFRQLQEISDTVRDIEWDGSLAESLEETNAEENEINTSINKHRARQRYLENLAENDDEGEEDNCCILCKCEFTRGFITQCAHVYCEGCLKAWLTRKEGKACPVCRVIIDPDSLQRITMKEKIESHAESSQKRSAKADSREAAPRSRRVIEYNTIDPEVFEEIQKVACLGSYGTKIETLVRHLLYLDDVDPGCKSIVFSAWADSLYILERALTENGILCLRIDQKKGKQNAAKLFKTDHRIRVLLLHGERENAGLNVTCASRVFLTESVVQHSFELQAIARIDRMGQTRPTEVYCYYAENTVERNILDLAAKRCLSLYTKDHAIGTLKVTSFDMDKTAQIDSPAKNNKKQKGQKGDFIFKTDDMLAILFPHLYEDVEYLLPDDEDADMLDTGDHELESDAAERSDDQPVAGPSRLI